MSPPSGSGLRLEHYLHILTERRQKTHQASAREVRHAPVEKRGDLRLIDTHQPCGVYLRQAATLDDLLDPACELRTRELLLRLGKAEIRENIARTRRYFDVRFSCHCS